MKDYIPLPLPFILGWDVSGVVEAVGSGVTKFRPILLSQIGFELRITDFADGNRFARMLESPMWFVPSRPQQPLAVFTTSGLQ